MTRVTYLLSKDPTLDHGGDIALSRLMMDITRDFADVRTICLSTEPDRAPVPGVTRVAKPKVSPSLLVGSARTRRSICHQRYDIDTLGAAIESAAHADDAPDIWVAEHSYMAESFLRARVPDRRFVINTVNTESQVWKVTRGILGRVEAPRILADEVRVAKSADAVGTYDAEEAEFYRSEGVFGARWIDLTLPPEKKLDLAETPQRLVFMGTRDWPPNQEAFEIALRLWPRISAGIPDAELCIIGAKAKGHKDPVYPPGVRDLGFVDDLHEFLSTCRALMAPIETGGGVRVKILDAASRGLPVIGTSAAIGSLGPVFGLEPLDDEWTFVKECRRYLLDREHARTQGDLLYERNAQRWNDGLPQRSVEELISPGQLG
ncbi:glycosyltransferase [Williamsia sterculiae]|uniref:Glycosyltransferase involved in cell wall bisynthesis n=1 Tax=Williamsia sterculiae TaxID=1344003 RepID=A0A1N7D008_9NOCA|nr:glycosyltransferase [Williamsia sterculiae]SIR69025.1 Glycosyltransferase involved in cell wall bisynthesis [Williamsia sterculiae]